MGTKLPKDKITELVNRYVNGELTSTLCKDFNISNATVLNYVRLSGNSVRTVAEGAACRGRIKGEGETAKNYTYTIYKSGAKSRGIEFSLTKEEFLSLVVQPCNYCGALPKNETKNATSGSFFYNGLDRVDSSMGYSTDNVVPCCIICNKAKSTLSLQEFLEWVSTINGYQQTLSKLAALENKLKNLNEWLAQEELEAARKMTVNVDYWQARLSAMAEVKTVIKSL